MAAQGNAPASLVAERPSTPLSAHGDTADETLAAIKPPAALAAGAVAPVKALRSATLQSASRMTSGVSSRDDGKARQSAPASLDSVGVIITALARTEHTGALLARAIRSAVGAHRIVAVVRDEKAVPTEISGRDDVEIIEMPELMVTEGRARNAAYRRLKKAMADIRFVQFLAPDAVLDPDWLKEALRFMDRRPEVVLLNGPVEQDPKAANTLSRLKLRGQTAPVGEVETTLSMAIVRADAFEAAGGFRGDLVGLDMDDLCIRLRRRGFHAWMISARMARQTVQVKGLVSWLSKARSDGAYYARAVALHGSSPEKFRVSERSRALVWGLGLPIFLIIAAIAGAAVTSVTSPQSYPLVTGLSIIALGVLVYVIKALIIIFRSGAGKGESWLYGPLLVAGHFAEAMGVLGEWFKKDKKRSSPAGAR